MACDVSPVAMFFSLTRYCHMNLTFFEFDLCHMVNWVERLLHIWIERERFTEKEGEKIVLGGWVSVITFFLCFLQICWTIWNNSFSLSQKFLDHVTWYLEYFFNETKEIRNFLQIFSLIFPFFMNLSLMFMDFIIQYVYLAYWDTGDNGYILCVI